MDAIQEADHGAISNDVPVLAKRASLQGESISGPQSETSKSERQLNLLAHHLAF